MDTLTTAAVIVALAAAMVGLAGGIVALRRAAAIGAADPGSGDRDRHDLLEARKLVRAGLCRFEIASGRAVWSDEMYRLAGRDPGTEPLGFWAFPDVVHADDRDDVRRRLHDAAAGAAPFDAAFRIVRPDGATTPVHGMARREVDDAGDVVYVHAAFAEVAAHEAVPVAGPDLPEPEEADARLAAAEAARLRAESVSRAKSESIAVLSHELRTPLNSILGFAAIIEAEMFGAAGSERYVDYARDILKSGQHIIGVLNDSLDLSRIESGRMELNEEPVDLLVVMRDAANLFLEQASSQGITMKTALPRNLPDLYADGRLIRQMLINLISNALRYTRRGGWIELTADRSDDDGIALSVADTGVGIMPKDAARILEPTRATGTPIGTSSRGTGIGLPLVKSLIELHGGTFRLDTAPDSGTVVRLSFPPARVRPNPGPGVRRRPDISVVHGGNEGGPKSAAGGGS